MALAIKEHICRGYHLPRSDAVLKARAEFLGQNDRDLVEAVLIEDQPVDVVARMKGMTIRTLNHHLHRLGRRMASSQFVQTIRSMSYLDPDDARIARRCFCQSASQRKLAVELGLSVHALRRRLDQVRARIDAIAGQKHPVPTAGVRLEQPADGLEVNG